MTKEEVEISVVVPVYNSSTVLNELCDKIVNVFAGIQTSYQLILVDDGSEDDSWDVIKKNKSKYPDTITAIRMAKNFSQHNALVCAFRYCRGKYIITIDDDLQNPPEEIPNLIKCLETSGNDMVYGISTKYKRPLYRRITRKYYKLLTRLTFDSTAEGSSFRILKKNLADKIITHNQQFVFIDELVSWYTKKIGFITVRHDETKVMKSRYPFSRLYTLYYNLVFGYNSFLLRMITVLGVSSSILSFIVGFFFLMKKIFFHVKVGFTGIVVSVTFIGGIILLSIGIIGEYLRRMFIILNGKPQYSVSEILD